MGFLNFSDRLKMAKEYNQWRKSQSNKFEVKDCFESAYIFIYEKIIKQKDEEIENLKKQKTETLTETKPLAT